MFVGEDEAVAVLMSFNSTPASSLRSSSASTKRCVALALSRPFFGCIYPPLAANPGLFVKEEKGNLSKQLIRNNNQSAARGPTGKPPPIPLEFPNFRRIKS